MTGIRTDSTVSEAESGAGIVATETLSGVPRLRIGMWFCVAVAGTFAVGLGATVYFCLSMAGGMDMPGDWIMSMMWMRMPGQSWLSSLIMFLLMWLSMMIAMMLPSATPMLLRYHSLFARESFSRPGAAAGVVACGYFGVWTAVGMAVYVIGRIWAAAAMRWDTASGMVPWLTGASLVMAGSLQFSRWKRAGLAHCHRVQEGVSPQRRTAAKTALRSGVQEGLACLKCTSGPMLVLLVLGVMNPLVMGVVAFIVTLEKLLPRPDRVVTLAGFAAIVAGIATILKPLL